MTERFIKLTKVVDEKMNKEYEEFPTVQTDSTRFRSHPTDISDDKNTDPKPTVRRRSRTSWIAAITKIITGMGRGGAIKATVTIASHHPRCVSDQIQSSALSSSFPLMRGAARQRIISHTAGFTRLRCNDSIASEMLMMRKEVAVQINEQAFSEKYPNSVINYLTELKRVYSSSQNHKGTTVLIFRDFMTSPALTAVKARLDLSSNDANKREGTITSYAEMVKHVMMRYTVDVVIAKADEEVPSFK